LSLSKGSAPVDFILVSVPLIMLTLSVLGVAINGYAKNIAQDVAVEAARYSALADQDIAGGQARAWSAIKAELGSVFKPEITGSADTSNGVCSNSIKITLKPIGLGLLSSNFKITESGTAVCELQ